MDSLLTQAYQAIVNAEKTVDAENTNMRNKLDVMAQANLKLIRQLSEAQAGHREVADKLAKVPTGDHDGGYIATAKGRKIGSPQDRATLDEIIERLQPEAVPVEAVKPPPAQIGRKPALVMERQPDVVLR